MVESIIRTIQQVRDRFPLLPGALWREVSRSHHAIVQRSTATGTQPRNSVPHYVFRWEVRWVIVNPEGKQGHTRRKAAPG